MQQTSQRILRLSLSGSLLALIALLTFNVGTTHAAQCLGLTTTETGASCDIAFNLMPASGILSFTADQNLTITNGTGNITGGAGTSNNPYRFTISGTTNQTFGISFTTIVTDDRGGTTGWNLAANTSTDAPTMSLDSLTTTCPAGGCFPTTLSNALPLTLTNSAKEFVGALATSTDVNRGTYNIVTDGTLTIPSGTPAGTPITGSLTLTLNNANYV